jgi:hypothetical protein
LVKDDLSETFVVYFKGCLFAGSLLLVACGDLPSGKVKENYTSSVRELGFSAVYPPREEFQVGDVYAVAFIPGTDQHFTSYLGDFPELRQSAADFLKSRVVFKGSIALNDGKTAPPTDQPDLFDSNFRTRGETDHTGFLPSLPIVAFPEIELGAGATTGLSTTNALTSIGFLRGKQTTVTLQFPLVKKYWVPVAEVQHTRTASGVPLSQAAGAIFNALEKNNLCNNQVIVDLKRKISFDAHRLGENRIENSRFRVGLVIVTAVYLAREIDYVYRNADINAVGLRVAETALNSSSLVTPKLDQNVPDNDTAGQETPQSVATASDIQTLSQKIDTLVATDAVEGQGFRLSDWNATGLTFNQYFARPVSVAYEAVPVNLSILPDAGSALATFKKEEEARFRQYQNSGGNEANFVPRIPPQPAAQEVPFRKLSDYACE